MNEQFPNDMGIYRPMSDSQLKAWEAKVDEEIVRYIREHPLPEQTD